MRKPIIIQPHNMELKKYSITIRPIKKFSDPKEVQIDLDADYLITKNHPDTSIHNDRVMPMVVFGDFCKILKAKTKCFKAIDDSHFWVSGYYAIYFYLKTEKDRLKMKRLVKEAVIESGGFMTFEAWYEHHGKKTTRILQFNGTGSGINMTYSNLPESIAFL